MSMRTYGVETKGLIITLSDFQVLISLNRKNIENKWEFNDRWQEVDLDNMEFDEIKDRNEIIAELKEDLSNVGIIVDDDYIEEHFGYISGSYFA